MTTATAPQKTKAPLTVREGGVQELKWDRNDPESVADAETTFNTLVKDRGHAAFASEGKVADFVPEAEELVIVAPLRGG